MHKYYGTSYVQRVILHETFKPLVLGRKNENVVPHFPAKKYEEQSAISIFNPLTQNETFFVLLSLLYGNERTEQSSKL